MPTSPMVLYLAHCRLSGVWTDLALRALGVTRLTSEGLRVIHHTLVDICALKFVTGYACAACWTTSCSIFSVPLNFLWHLRVNLGVEHLLFQTPPSRTAHARLEDHRMIRWWRSYARRRAYSCGRAKPSGLYLELRYFTRHT